MAVIVIFLWCSHRFSAGATTGKIAPSVLIYVAHGDAFYMVFAL